MKKFLTISVISIMLLSSCNSYNSLLKSQDYDYKYEAAKEFYMNGQYTRAYQILEELVMVLKGSDRGEESLFMLGMCYYNLHDYETATMYLDRYAKSYSKGEYTELARFFSGKASYLQSPDPRLDQSPTYAALNQLQDFLDFYPYSTLREDVNDMIYELQNRLVQKEYDSAKLYYNLGSYVGNCTNGGSNYDACIITAENALRSYPYTRLREDLYMLILRSRYQLAQHSVDEKSEERYRQTVDEYYGFKNEFPESKYMKEADHIFKHSNPKAKEEEE
ncbi:MAG: outer membrane protein assembly factor BamD [Prevotellaceae bacterium]|nr:outer membrane protein assembly factor BamD [Candidatus Minthosoma caballi]